MDLFKLRGVIEVDNTDANKKLGETSEQGGKAQSKLSSAFSKIGKGAAVVGKAVAGGMVAAGTAIGGLVAQSTSAYAEYEQLVGGVDTLFKGASKKVQEYAANAYKTAGLSANAYMETVTSFSASLLQSLGGDTQKAADYSNQAVIDMSDNANKMGTSMESIQNAYQGFAKQNYTMLDNLKLGYGGTKGEMERLIADANRVKAANGEMANLSIDSFADVTEAIHIIQSEMGITGTTAVEAEGTITGSMASVKASWANLVTAMASDNLPLDEYITKFVNSATGVVSNMLPRIQKALDGAVQLIQKLAPVIIGAIPDLLSQLLPSVITAATELISAIVEILPSLIDTLVNDLLPQIIDGFTTIITALVEALPQLIEAIVSALPTLLPQLIDAFIAVIVAICTNFSAIIQPLIDYLPEIIVSIVDALISNLPLLIQGCISLIVGLCNAQQQILGVLWETIKGIFVSLVTNLAEWFSPVTEWFKSAWENLKNIVSNVWETIKTVVKVAIELVGSILQAAFDIITLPFRFIWENCKEYVFAAWEWIKEKISAAIEVIKAVVQPAFEWIKDKIITPIKNAVDQAKETFELMKMEVTDKINALKEKVTSIFNAIKEKIMTPINAAKSVVTQVFSTIKADVTEKIDAVKTKVSNVFNKIKTSITKPVKEAKDKVKEYVDKIKEFFNGFSAKIKLPHFTIKNASLNPKKWIENGVPKLSVEWYKDGGIFTEGIMERPTAFGISSNGALRVGGEAGAEAVAPISKLQEYVAVAATQGNAELAEKLDTLISLLTLYLPLLMKKELMLDTGALVGELVNPLNKALGDLTRQRERGRA